VKRPARPLPARGFSLFEAMISLAVLAFGMVAMVQFQGRLVSQTTESQSRQTANQFAGELLGTVLVDAPNASCYTLPQAGACTNDAAKLRTAAWAERVEAALPAASANSTLDAVTGRLTVAITWTGKASQDTRRLESTTDVR
jgi:type IV pilus assembly protein PilV